MLFLPALLLAFTSCRHEAVTAPANPKDTLLIYLMAGQSNMAGRGLIGPEDTGTNPRILTMNATNEWELAREPLDFYEPSIAGLSCGTSFARTLLSAAPANARIGLIPCAIGSSSIEEWLSDYVRIVPLYTNLLTRAKAGMKTGVIKGILWHQGESDAEDMRAWDYSRNMQLLIGKVRHDLGTDVPVYLAKLAAFTKRPNASVVNSAIDETAAALPNVWVIETADLSCNADSLHFDANGQRIMGMRFAQAAKLWLKK